MKNISIIVLNWNKPDLTIECLESLEKINSKKFKTEVLVVDNGSSDGSVKQIQQFLVNKFRPSEHITSELIETGVNKGFAGGNNYGIRHALQKGADYIILLNNDTRVDPDFAIELLYVMTSEEEVGVVCPKIYFEKGYEFKEYTKTDLGKVFWSVGGVLDWNNIYGTNRGVDQIDCGQFERIENVDFASGACLLVSKETLNKSGLFDESYFMYLEDLDLCHRIKHANYKILYAPKSIIWHKVSQSSKIGGDLNDYFITRNRLIFGFRYASIRTKLALLREALRFILRGRKWQRIGTVDYFIQNLGRGSWV